MVVFHMHKSGICVCLGIAVAILPANCLLSVILHPAAIQESQFIPLPNDFRLVVPAAFFTSMPCASISVLSCSSLFSTLVEVRFPCGHTSSFNRALIFSSCLLTCFSHTNVYRFALLSILVPSTNTSECSVYPFILQLLYILKEQILKRFLQVTVAPKSCYSAVIRCFLILQQPAKYQILLHSSSILRLEYTPFM